MGIFLYPCLSGALRGVRYARFALQVFLGFDRSCLVAGIFVRTKLTTIKTFGGLQTWMELMIPGSITWDGLAAHFG